MWVAGAGLSGVTPSLILCVQRENYHTSKYPRLLDAGQDNEMNLFGFVVINSVDGGARVVVLP